MVQTAAGVTALGGGGGLRRSDDALEAQHIIGTECFKYYRNRLVK